MQSIARLSLEKSFKFQKKLSSGGFPGTAWHTGILDDWPHHALDLLWWRPYHHGHAWNWSDSRPFILCRSWHERTSWGPHAPNNWLLVACRFDKQEWETQSSKNLDGTIRDVQLLRSHRHWISHGDFHRRPKDWYTMPGVVALCHPNQAVLAANIKIVRSMEVWSIAADAADVNVWRKLWNFVGRLKLWSKSVQHRISLGWLVRKGLSHSLSQWSTRIYEFVILRWSTVRVPAKCSKWSVESWLSGFFNSKIHRLSLCGLVFSGICRQRASFSAWLAFLEHPTRQQNFSCKVMEVHWTTPQNRVTQPQALNFAWGLPSQT